MCLGIPAKIQSISDAELGLALAETCGVKRHINVALLVAKGQSLDSLVGQWVLLHVGFAMALIDEQEAARSLSLLTQMGGENTNASL